MPVCLCICQLSFFCLFVSACLYINQSLCLATFCLSINQEVKVFHLSTMNLCLSLYLIYTFIKKLVYLIIYLFNFLSYLIFPLCLSLSSFPLVLFLSLSRLCVSPMRLFTCGSPCSFSSTYSVYSNLFLLRLSVTSLVCL